MQDTHWHYAEVFRVQLLLCAGHGCMMLRGDVHDLDFKCTGIHLAKQPCEWFAADVLLWVLLPSQ